MKDPVEALCREGATMLLHATKQPGNLIGVAVSVVHDTHFESAVALKGKTALSIALGALIRASSDLSREEIEDVFKAALDKVRPPLH